MRKALWAGLGVAAALAVAVIFQDRVPAPGLESRKVIFLGPGLGHVAYTMGFIGGLLEDASTRNALLSANATFGGASSGVHTAAYAVASLHGVLSMREWYMRDMRAGYEAIGKHSTLIMGQELEAAGYRYYDTCHEQLGGRIPWLHHFVMSFTEIPTLRPRYLTSFPSRKKMAQAAMASSFLPGLMGFRPWGMILDGLPVFDGYLGLLRADLPENYLYISFLPNVPHFLLRNTHYLSVTRFDTTKENLLTKCFPWGDPAWADAAFERGWKDATAHIAELRTAIVSFLKS